MFSSIINYVLLFFVYAFFGWLVEIIYNRCLNKKWVNRGFLIGPICPIYGSGCLLLILLLDRYSKDFFALFLGSIFICSILEYFTSYFLEKIFKARWWDYSNFKYNINGRICLETMIPFGLFGSNIVGIVNPFLEQLVVQLQLPIRVFIAVLFIVIILIDFIISFKVVSSIKGSIKFLNGDNTDEIKEKIKNIFLLNSYIYRRLLKAFPDLFIKFVNFNKLEVIRRKVNKKNRDN